MGKKRTITCTCGKVFIGNPNRRFCDDCRQRSLMARCKQAPIDLSADEIDRRFKIALAAVRREGAHTVPLDWSMQWRYGA